MIAALRIHLSRFIVLFLSFNFGFFFVLLLDYSLTFFICVAEVNWSGWGVTWAIWTSWDHLNWCSWFGILLKQHFLSDFIIWFDCWFNDWDVMLSIEFLCSNWVSLFLLLKLFKGKDSLASCLSRGVWLPNEPVWCLIFSQILFWLFGTLRLRITFAHNHLWLKHSVRIHLSVLWLIIAWMWIDTMRLQILSVVYTSNSWFGVSITICMKCWFAEVCGVCTVCKLSWSQL